MNRNRGWAARRRVRWRRRRGDLDCFEALDCGDAGCDCLSLVGPSLVLTLVGVGRGAAVAPGTPRPRTVSARLAWRLVRSYQVNVSARRGPVCNLSPSCSWFGLRALTEHGLVRGSWLIRDRLAQCRAAGRTRRAAGRPDSAD